MYGLQHKLKLQLTLWRIDRTNDLWCLYGVGGLFYCDSLGNKGVSLYNILNKSKVARKYVHTILQPYS